MEKKTMEKGDDLPYFPVRKFLPLLLDMPPMRGMGKKHLTREEESNWLTEN